MVRTLFALKNVVTCNNSFEIFRNGVIVVEDGNIIYVGKREGLPYNKNYFDFIIEEEYGIAMPGLINCHTHAAMSLFKGVADDLPLNRWLNEVIWPLESKVDSESLLYGNYIAIMEMLSSGTTTFADFYFFKELIESVRTIPIRSVATVALMDMVADGESYWKRLKNIGYFIEVVNSVDGGRVTLALGPHAIYTCTEPLLREVVKVSIANSLPIQIHLSETVDEQNYSRLNFGMSPVEYLDRINILSNRVFAAHCIYLNDKDIRILSDRHVNCVHDPSSNLKLASGIMPMYSLVKQGINVCLGTDGCASANSLNMLGEMRLALILQRGLRLDPTFPTAKDVLLMATLRGAKALGLDKKIGSIEEGKRADFVIFNGRSPRLLPEYDVVSNIVYSSNPLDITYTVVDGKVLYEHGRFSNLDIEKIFDVFGTKALALLKDAK